MRHMIANDSRWVVDTNSLNLKESWSDVSFDAAQVSDVEPRPSSKVSPSDTSADYGQRWFTQSHGGK